jgi:acetyltransferase-like isoleucine patch superfamily enzyme
MRIIKFKRAVKHALRAVVGHMLRPMQLWSASNYICYGDRDRINIGQGVSLLNTTINTASGCVFIGEDTVFGHNCMLITGRHDFLDGRRKKLVIGGAEAPTKGFDIKIDKGCWIASGVIVSGGVSIGDNVIVGAGAVVTKDIPSGCFAAGVPSKILRKLDSHQQNRGEG